MPLFLIRETEKSPMVTIAVPVVTHEIEVEAEDLRAAAEAVMDRPRGRLPQSMCRRETREPYTGTYIRCDPAKYAGIADIVAGNRATLPPAPEPPAYTPRQESLAAARAVLAANSKALGIDDDGSTRIAVYHLLHALIDHAHSVGADFGTTLREVLNDRPDVTGHDAPTVGGTAIGTDPDDAIPGSVAAGKAALDLCARMDPMEGSEDHDITLYHLLHSVLDVCEADGVNFGEIVDQVREDRPEATSTADRIPTM